MRERDLFDFAGQLENSVSFFEPRTKSGRMLIDPKNNFWREPPYFHEQVLVSCWIYLAEGNPLKSKDVEHLVLILNWIAGLSEKQLQHDQAKRLSAPVLLSKKNKLRLSQQAENLEISRFYEQNDWRSRLFYLLRLDIGAISQLFKAQVSQIEQAIRKEASKLNSA